MKRLAIPVAILALGLAGCGSDSSTPTQPSNITVFTVNMLPSLETPPITNSEQSARGTAVITVHKDTNAIDFNVSVNSFPAGSALNNAHIHNGAAGVPAGVFVGTGIAAANFPAITNGSATFTTTVTATADQVSQILANPAGFYFNVHSVANPSGVMRAQLK
jgi:CHRD domain-containing protein